MVSIQPINYTNRNKTVISPMNTGYAALGGFCLTTASAMVKSPKIKNLHKPLAFITAALTFLHLGCVLQHHADRKNQQAMNNNLPAANQTFTFNS